MKPAPPVTTVAPSGLRGGGTLPGGGKRGSEGGGGAVRPRAAHCKTSASALHVSAQSLPRAAFRARRHRRSATARHPAHRNASHTHTTTTARGAARRHLHRVKKRVGRDAQLRAISAPAGQAAAKGASERAARARGRLQAAGATIRDTGARMRGGGRALLAGGAVASTAARSGRLVDLWVAASAGAARTHAPRWRTQVFLIGLPRPAPSLWLGGVHAGGGTRSGQCASAPPGHAMPLTSLDVWDSPAGERCEWWTR